MTLYVLNYNNYYNRILKKLDSIGEYSEYVIYTLETANFNPNDGVNTTHVIGASVPYNGEGNYLLVVNNDFKIVSRWFIIDGARIRGGQYQLTLRRDLLADFKDEVLNSPCFVEKGNLRMTDPMIFNSENMTFNQIKTSEILLKDKSKCPWIIGYYAKNAEDLRGTVKTNELVDVPAINIDTPINNWIYSQYQESSFLGVSKKLNQATGMGIAVIFVMVVATAATWPIQHYVLDALGLGYMQTIVFILIIAALVQFVEMFLQKMNELGIGKEETIQMLQGVSEEEK